MFWVFFLGFFCHVKCTGLCSCLEVLFKYFFLCLLTGKLKNQFYSLLSVDHLFLTEFLSDFQTIFNLIQGFAQIKYLLSEILTSM